MRIAYCFALAALLLASGCGKRHSRVSKTPAPVRKVRVGETEEGIASWYGHPYHGRKTANGEIYDQDRLTAAHRDLPFGVWVEVRNKKNSKKVEVRINDRGPFVDGRIIDLSRAAAQQLEMIGPGTVPVRVKVIRTP